MNRTLFLTIAERLLRQPTAPYFEQGVRAEVEAICSKHGLSCRRDRFGNLLVRTGVPSKTPCFTMAAHMDHPGFALVRQTAALKWVAEFRGGVPASYFQAGTSLRLFPGGVGANLGDPSGKPKHYALEVRRIPATPPRFATWDLEEFKVSRGRIYARACDDLIGVACTLVTLIQLKRNPRRVNALGILSRAEELGFHGALACANSGRLPRKGVLVSLETSRELPGAKMGAGVIIRVGDKSSVFDSDATRFLTEVAGGLAAKKKGFQFQRALMSGGTCEATAYQEFGYRSAAVCVALGNYHNCGPKNAIRSEFINIDDALGMVELLTAAARRMGSYGRLVATLPERLKKLLREAERRLSAHSREG